MTLQGAAAKGLKVECDIAPALRGVELLGDPQRITELLLNFAGNAVKFTDSGFVRLSARSEGSPAPQRLTVRFEVQDSGIGIDADAQDRLFQDFEQADKSTTRRYGGTGLGLAICRRLAELMGGRVGVDSKPGRGSCFWFQLDVETAAASEAHEPMANTLTRSHTARERLAALAATQPRKVLLAEDNPVNQEVAVALIGSTGVVVDVASDGQQAVDMVKNGDYALVLMDVQMPVLDGLDATRAIRRLPQGAQLPILAMTANAFDEERQRCLDAGMDDHVAKPVVAEQLFTTLYDWLSGQRKTAKGTAL